ncbi:LysM peptidoglycan-binding domain-containing protein [Gordonia sp. (in: high G+C Gram-positive bacteria)]|uniref:LysM peptidoglycan-binding domain-containing protein n=1 Tax=Gordonia sp. (in: high G+C Gram-positive bacteria) TaxID=84139 RepID=UPI003C7764E5
MFESSSNVRGVTQRSNYRSNQAAVYRRRRVVGALLVGGALAAMVWMFAIVGANLESTPPAAPQATEVVYVRAGESLTSLAQRIAPDLPTAGVIAQLREINGLETSGLAVGQALRVPAYK